jgi:hypothetical protein
MRTKAINMLVDEALPEDMRDPQRQLDAKSVGRLLHMVATFHPEQYADVTKNIGDVGRDAAYWRGSTIGLDDLEDPIDTQRALREMDKQEGALKKTLANDPEGFAAAREALWHRTAATLERDSMGAALSKNNSIGLAVASGARGKPLQLRSMLSTPAVFADSRGRTIPIFARRSYSQGVSPAEFLAGTHGARASVIATKRSTAKGGFLGKVLIQNAGNLMVTEDDCGTHNGIDIDASDPTLKLRFLAQDAAGLKSGDLLDRKAVARIADRHKGTLLVRSPITCEAEHGICAKCLGADPRGHLRPVGFAAGVTAAQSIGEPLAQGALNCLAAGTLVQMADGTVRRIEEVKPGEQVLGASIAGETFPVTVLALHDQGLQPVHAFSSGERQVVCTSAHPLLFKDPQRGAVRMPVGLLADGALVASHTEDGITYAPVSHVAELEVVPCWDISVDHPDELFVLANGLVVKNTKHCLLKGTRVRMADLSVKCIEDIQVGDTVLGADKKGVTFPVRVSQTWDQGMQAMCYYKFEHDGSVLELACTREHKMLTNVGSSYNPETTTKTESQAVMRSGLFAVVAGSGVAAELTFARISVSPRRTGHCFDISVEHPDELFVLENGLIVSNTSGAASAKKEFSGFDVINRFVQVPDEFPDKAPVAEESGNVTVNKAPQGGHYVRVGETEHYVPAGVELRVKTHDTVEQGDVLADGLARPNDIVRLRGLGSGRRYYAERLSKILEDSGMPPDRRNVEVIARAAVNHVRIDDPEIAGDGVLPDDVVPYSTMVHNVTAPDDATYDAPGNAIGKHLYAPALHYTVGTKLTPRMTKRIADAGIANVFTSAQAPGFHADMTRLQTATHANPDWLAAMNTSYLQKQVSERALRGQDTNIESNINYAPRLAVGENFGAKTKSTGMF